MSALTHTSTHTCAHAASAAQYWGNASMTQLVRADTHCAHALLTRLFAEVPIDARALALMHARVLCNYKGNACSPPL
eukprot:10172000-Alexandrium_andersonii.AAC.1